MSCVQQYGLPLEEVLPLFTANTARALKLDGHGRLGEGCAANLLVLHPDSLAVQHVVCRGQVLARDGRVVAQAAGTAA